MKTVLLKQIEKILLAIGIILFTVIPSISQNFECNSNLYQVVNGKELKLLIPSLGTYETIGTSSISYNGAGFNIEDNYIYGIASGNRLVRVDNAGEATDLGAISNFSALSYSGDFDLDGNWHSFKSSRSKWIMNKVDVSELPAVAQETELTELAGVTSAKTSSDVAYNAVSNKFYGMNGGILMEFDHINNTVKAIADYSAQADNGAYGAVWSDESGNTYFFNNGTGNIFRAQIDASGNVLTFAFVSTSSPNGSNDGMSCPVAQAPVFPEICDNGIDDDGDGLIDCEDPDCASSENCGVSGVVYGSTFACSGSITTFQAFFTNNSSETNYLTVTETLPQGFVFLQDTIEFDAGGFSDFSAQPVEGDQGVINWGTITLEGNETVRISYDVVVNDQVQSGTQSNSISVELSVPETTLTPSVLSTNIEVGNCPSPNTYSCEPAFYQVYKKKGKKQPNVFGKLDPLSGDYDQIAIASDYANGLGFDINSGLVYGASGKRFISLDENGLVLDQGISFTKNVYRGDINENSEWFGAVGSDIVKIDVSSEPIVVNTFTGEALPGWDMAYNKDGHFYAIHNQMLYQFNSDSNSKVTIGPLNGSGLPTSGGYGAQWTGSDGYLYASHNSTGNIIRVNVTTGEARVVSLSIDGLSKNDGFSCPAQIPAVYEFDYGDNSRLPISRIMTYTQDSDNNDIPDFQTFWFGNTVTPDENNPSNSDASGDLDDGFNLSTQIYEGTLSAVVGLNANKTGTAYYLIGIDWDNNGTFDEVLTRSKEISTANTTVELINTPTGFEGGFINVRAIVSEFELSSTHISGDIFEVGEVEDFRYEILPPCVGEDCEAPTGSNGGLESNGALASAIAKRNYSRVKNSYNKGLQSNQLSLDKYRSSSYAARGSALDTYFPDAGATGKEVVTVSSPEDLVDITNASEVFAADYYLKDKRVAASLLLATEDQVYNHSKNVCDRLNGKTIEDINMINIEGVNIIFAQILHEAGAIEYSAWFSANEYDDRYELFSQWNIDAYPEGQYLNFQVWSSTPDQLVHIVKHAINKLKDEKPVEANLDAQQLPDVIVKSGRYENGELLLTLMNKKGVSSANIEVSLRKTEQQQYLQDEYIIELNGNEKQEVVLPIGFLFDAGVSVKVPNNDKTYDALYLADGAWGTDFNSPQTKVSKFDILEVDELPRDDDFLVERGFEVNGNSTDVMNVFKNLRAGENSLTINEFSTISFDIKNNRPLELILVEKGLKNWEDRLRVQLPIHASLSNVIVNFSDFFDGSLPEQIEIQTIVFSYLNKSGKDEYFDFKAHNIILGNERVLSLGESKSKSPDLVIYPNPATTNIKIKGALENSKVSLINMFGTVVFEREITRIELEQGITIDVEPGLYVIQYNNTNGSSTSLLRVN